MYPLQKCQFRNFETHACESEEMSLKVQILFCNTSANYLMYQFKRIQIQLFRIWRHIYVYIICIYTYMCMYICLTYTYETYTEPTFQSFKTQKRGIIYKKKGLNSQGFKNAQQGILNDYRILDDSKHKIIVFQWFQKKIWMIPEFLIFTDSRILKRSNFSMIQEFSMIIESSMIPNIK